MSEHQIETVSGVEESDPDAFSTITIGIVSVLLLVVVIVAVEAMFAQQAQAEFERKVVAESPEEIRSLRAAQLGQISGYRVVDPKAGVVAVPIDRAMELVIEERRGSGGAAKR